MQMLWVPISGREANRRGRSVERIYRRKTNLVSVSTQIQMLKQDNTKENPFIQISQDIALPIRGDNHNGHNIFWQREWLDGVYGRLVREDPFAVLGQKRNICSIQKRHIHP